MKGCGGVVDVTQEEFDSILKSSEPFVSSPHRLKQKWLPALYRYYAAQGHSPWGASGRDRYSACPGSPRLIATLPPVKQKSNKYADRGTLAHDTAAAYLEYVLHGGKPSNIASLDPELQAIVKYYVDWVLLRYNSYGGAGHAEVWIEKRIRIDEAHPEASGSTDAMIYAFKERHLDVIDLKTGGGDEIIAEENKQLLFYGAGSYWEIKRPILTASLIIVQPPLATKWKEWKVTGDRLFAETYLIQKEIEACEVADAPLVPGTKQCKYCPAAGICPARSNEAFELVKADFADTKALVVAPPLLDGQEPGVSMGIQEKGYDPELLARCYEALPRIKNWIKQVSHFAHVEAAQGRPPPGFKLVDKRKSPRKWKPGVEAQIIANEGGVLGMLVDLARLVTKKLISPAQLLDICPEAREIIEALSQRPPSGVTLVSESDKRVAIQQLDPESDFEDLLEETDE